MSDEGLIAVFRGKVLVWTGNPIPADFLKDGDTVHLGIGVFDASMFDPKLSLMIIGAGDDKDAGSGTRIGGGFLSYNKDLASRNMGLFTGQKMVNSEHWSIRKELQQQDRKTSEA